MKRHESDSHSRIRTDRRAGIENGLTTAEAALRLAISTRAVRTLIATGALEAERDGQRWSICPTSVRREEQRRSTDRRQPVESSTSSLIAADSFTPAVPLTAGQWFDRFVGAKRLLVLVAAVGLVALSVAAVRGQVSTAEPLLAGPTAVEAEPTRAVVDEGFAELATAPAASSGPTARDQTILMMAGAGIRLGAQLILVSGAWSPRGRGR